jgi:hypothetical protein
MEQALDESALTEQARGVPLGITFMVIVVAGLTSWAVVLACVYFAWTAIRSFMS